MATIHLPPSWGKMAFCNQQYYLVDTHQAKDLCQAAKIITKMTNDKLRAAIKAAAPKLKLWYRDAD